MSYPHDFCVFDRLKVVDWGDVYHEHAYPEDFLLKSEAAVTTVLDAGCATLGLGGDHFVTYPILRAHAKKLGRAVALIHFDAHSDTWESELKSHGTMFYHAAREGIVDASRSIQIGMRTHNTAAHGFTVLDARAARRLLPEEIAQLIRETVGDAPCYLTFDIDCLDPAFAPGTGTPVAGGLTSADALEVLEHLSGVGGGAERPLNVVGADVVEVAPQYDVSEITTLVAAQIVHSELHLIYRAREAHKMSGNGGHT